MGHKDQRPLTQDDLKEALRKRDEQINSLEARIDAYIARTSETQARLIKTIDLIDSLKAQHIINLAVKEHQLPENHFKPSDTSCRDSEDILEYDASVITRLRTELDHERKAHCKAVEEANLRISELEAKVAAREVLLEASIRNHQKRDKSPLDRSRQPRNLESEIPPPKPMTDEDCLRVLADSNTRNKTLEIEIRSLARKLERARGPADPSACNSADAVPVGFSPPPRIAFPDHPHQPVIPRQPPTTSITEAYITSTLHTISTLPAGSHVVTRPSSHNSPTASFASASQRSIVQLDDQINAYASQLEDFKAERKALVEISDGGDPPDFPQILGYRGGMRKVGVPSIAVSSALSSNPYRWSRLASRVSHLEQDLEHSRSSAKSREHELLKEIDALKLSLHQQSPSLYHAHDAQHLDDGIDVEQNMELATPLQPTAILSWNNLGSSIFSYGPTPDPTPFLT
ncbi:hypothetical protein EDB19DRAFT_1904396 [Suillus lakei]|nr:hypothetical protein EDB19DRAFT_1904396 [Suillus lakei]